MRKKRIYKHCLTFFPQYNIFHLWFGNFVQWTTITLTSHSPDPPFFYPYSLTKKEKKKNPKANLCCLCTHQSMIKLLVTSPLKITESLIDRKAEGGATDNLIKMQTYSFVLTLLTQDDGVTDFLFYLFISFF